MLISRPLNTAVQVEVSNVHNYYEKLVTEAIINSHERASTDADFLADISCVALNHLPPRYIRYDVDMVFFMSPTERGETNQKVQEAVDYAIDFVINHEEKKQVSDTEASNKVATDTKIDTDH